MTQLKRSSYHQILYPDDLMMDAFGKLNPSVSERSQYFFELWMKRKEFELVFDGNYASLATYASGNKKVLGALGLRDPWDYQLKANAIRFGSAQDMAVFKIARGNTHG
tara:strand:+ start:191 stop:514 length:324 start_codon:yes stop_codon:yes gene_type:complete